LVEEVEIGLGGGVLGIEGLGLVPGCDRPSPLSLQSQELPCERMEVSILGMERQSLLVLGESLGVIACCERLNRLLIMPKGAIVKLNQIG
jgi:hypothetical protein